MFFWNSLAFSMIQQMLTIWSQVPLSFLKPAWTSGSSWFTYCWSLAWRILSFTLLACEMSAHAGVSSLSLFQGSSLPRDQTQVSHIAGRRFNLWATREAPYYIINSQSISFTYGDMYVSMLLSEFVPPSSSPAVSTSLFSMCHLHFFPVNRFIITIFLESIYMR